MILYCDTKKRKTKQFFACPHCQLTGVISPVMLLLYCKIMRDAEWVNIIIKVGVCLVPWCFGAKKHSRTSMNELPIKNQDKYTDLRLMF